ncbi:hypothetical protein B0H11DRAFT_2270349, partial [Mycena galericulata]
PSSPHLLLSSVPRKRASSIFIPSSSVFCSSTFQAYRSIPQTSLKHYQVSCAVLKPCSWFPVPLLCLSVSCLFRWLLLK